MKKIIFLLLLICLFFYWLYIKKAVIYDDKLNVDVTILKENYLKNKTFENCIRLVDSSYDNKLYADVIQHSKDCLILDTSFNSWIYMVMSDSYFNLELYEKAYVFAVKSKETNKNELGKHGEAVINKIINNHE